MAIETANYISQLDPTNPAGPDMLADTDNHLRLIKQALKNTFPNLTGPVTANANQMGGYVPIGGIIMWSGNAASVPAGWALCTGQSVARSDGGGNITTPNLTDKFTVGLNAAGTNYGATGGSQTPSGTTGAAGAHTHTGYTDAQGAHSHGGATAPHYLNINEIPNHSHGYYQTVAASGAATGTYYYSFEVLQSQYRTTDGAGGGGAHAHGIYSDGNHAHTVTTYGAADHTHTVAITDGRPPFFAIAYIMKV